MANNLMYIPNDDTQNYHICRLQLLVKMFGHSTFRTKQSKFNNKSPKLSSQLIRKSYYKTLGTKVINSPMSPHSQTTILLFPEREATMCLIQKSPKFYKNVF